MKWFLPLLLLLINGSIQAQIFTEVPTPFEGIETGSIAFADIDNDNDQDLLITGRNAATERIARLYQNDGSGTFTEVPDTPFEGVHLSSVAFADVDNDNDQDVLIAGRTASGARIAKLYKNDGSGVFSEVPGTPFAGVSDCFVAFADIDNDNDQDLLITGYGGTTSFAPLAKMYINDGTGAFIEQGNLFFQGVEYSTAAFADVDGDNDQDLVITGRKDINTALANLYINDGNGNFSDAQAPLEGVEFCAVAFSDIDGDNDFDLLIAGQDNLNIQSTILYTNDGNGNFTANSTVPFPDVSDGSLAFADVDSDDDQDLLITGIGTNGALSKIYKNNGSGSFSEVTGLGLETVFFSSAKFADVDGDDDPDLVIAGSGSQFMPVANLYINETVVQTTEAALFSRIQLKAFPNPASTSGVDLEVHLQQTGSVSLQLMDLNGKTVYVDRRQVQAGRNLLHLEWQALPAGAYTLKVSHEEGSVIEKLVIQ